MYGQLYILYFSYQLEVMKCKMSHMHTHTLIRRKGLYLKLHFLHVFLSLNGIKIPSIHPHSLLMFVFADISKIGIKLIHTIDQY